MVKRRVRRAVSPPSTTLFAAPAPVQSHSRLYTHGHSQALIQVRGRSGSQSRSRSRSRSQSRSSWDEESNADSASEQSVLSQTSSTSERVANGTPLYHEASHRRQHLQKIFDLLHLSIARRDGVRAFRCLRILLKSHEWRPIELWRYALEVATMVAVDGRRHENETNQEQDSKRARADRQHIAQKRLAFLREVGKIRTGLQLDIFIETIPELLVLGEDEQALAEIDIVLNQYPFRLEPILHLYSALIFLHLSSPSASSSYNYEWQSGRHTLKEVTKNDQRLAVMNYDLLLLRDRGHQTVQSILSEAERKFETVLNVGKIETKRGRIDVARSRSANRSRSRSRSKSRGRQANTGRSRDGNMESSQDDEPGWMATDEERDEGRVEIGNDAWARNLARAYLAVLRAQVITDATPQESDEEMLDEQWSD